MFIDKVYNYIQEKYNAEFGELVITEVRIGVFLAAVRLSNDLVGVASVINNDEIHQVEKKDRDFGQFSPLHIIGYKVSDLFEFSKNTALTQILKIAVLNVYFNGILNSGEYNYIKKTDPIDIIELNDYNNIVMVGAFNSYIRKISESGCNLRVLELDENAFMPHHKKFYVPADQYKNILPEADLIIVTGLTLVNNTFDDLLKYIPKESMSVVIGPSASMVPDIFFRNDINMIGGTLITDVDKLFQLVSQGAAGYHLFEYCAEKITLINE
ncbi:MAG: DUF364 domain-containing protein [Saprospiraceae bacterium]